MQIVHEFGHVLAAWWTGGVVDKVVLRPWTISQTQLSRNPEPLTVAWAGPVIGAALPLLAWLTAKLLRIPGAYLLRFFAGFCLISNGVYLGAGTLENVGDAGDLQRHGSFAWLLFLFAVVAVPSGIWLWHNQGRHFGFGGAGGHVDDWAIAACVTTMFVLLGLELLLGLH